MGLPLNVQAKLGLIELDKQINEDYERLKKKYPGVNASYEELTKLEQREQAKLTAKIINDSKEGSESMMTASDGRTVSTSSKLRKLLADEENNSRRKQAAFNLRLFTQTPSLSYLYDGISLYASSLPLFGGAIPEDYLPILPIYLSIENTPVAFTDTPINLSKVPKVVNTLTKHLKGDDAVKMFKEYGGVEIPKNSINYEQLMQYVPEARERYGLIGNVNITDLEIAEALYKHSLELGGNTAAINSVGEPLLLFRGDTSDYTELLNRTSPEELAIKKGTMDNSLGNLFLGEFPGTYPDRYNAVGVSRYLNGRYFNPLKDDYIYLWEWRPSGTGKGSVDTPRGYRLFFNNNGTKGNYQGFVKDASTEEYPNRLNAFIVRTPSIRDATREISVLDDDFLLLQGKNGPKGSYLGNKYKVDPKTYHLIETNTNKSLGEITTGNSPEERLAIADHYSELLKDAEIKNQGLLKSNRLSPLREEHHSYTYFALPNFNIRGAKHLLPYDLRIPRNWNDPNIYKITIPTILGGTYLTNETNEQD